MLREPSATPGPEEGGCEHPDLVHAEPLRPEAVVRRPGTRTRSARQSGQRGTVPSARIARSRRQLTSYFPPQTAQVTSAHVVFRSIWWLPGVSAGLLRSESLDPMMRLASPLRHMPGSRSCGPDCRGRTHEACSSVRTTVPCLARKRLYASPQSVPKRLGTTRSGTRSSTPKTTEPSHFRATSSRRPSSDLRLRVAAPRSTHTCICSRATRRSRRSDR